MFKTINTTNSNVIFLDIDDTICSTREAVLEIYNELTGSDTKDNYTSKKYVSFCPMWTDTQISDLFRFGARNIYEKAKVLEGAKQGVGYLLSLGFDVRLVSLNYAESVCYKQEWVNRHFPELSNKLYIGTDVASNKDIFKGFAIIDDDFKNIRTSGCKYPILLDVHNVYDNINYQHKFTSWKDLVDNF